MDKQKGHLICAIEPGSIAEEMELKTGDRVLAINDKEIEDVFDYEYLIKDEYIELLVITAEGEEWELDIEKDYDQDLGIIFENGLMSDYRSCSNKCIFCFIDQMPPGMRETLYFKDDDSRLSFLQGNYITLTNMKEKDIQRIIDYKLSPINISVHTTNPELRCKMLHNRFAGESLKKIQTLYEAGVEMNGQIVLCKNVNDKEELERSIRDLSQYIPYMESVSVVPVGLSKFREGLYPLEPFTKEDAEQTIDLIEQWQRKLYQQYGTHFIHASDEFYILAQRSLPEEERYDGYIQLENGVGMLRLLMEEANKAMEVLHGDGRSFEFSLATGKLAFPYIKAIYQKLKGKFPNIVGHLYSIKNEFFGETITVSGLITGRDLRNQLMEQSLGKQLLLPSNMFRSGEDVFLDDVTKQELERTLQVSIRIVKSSGQDLIDAMLGQSDLKKGEENHAPYELEKE